VSGRPPDATLLRVEAKLAAIDSKIDLLLARLAPGPRDRGDVALVATIVKGAKGRQFTAAALWRHRTVDSVLADSLLAVDIDNPRQLGKLLRRFEGRIVDGVRIDCVGLHREGKLWHARVQE
jgi:hypothetical protein